MTRLATRISYGQARKWRNGIRVGLKNRCSQGLEGSNPSFRKLSLRRAFGLVYGIGPRRRGNSGIKRDSSSRLLALTIAAAALPPAISGAPTVRAQADVAPPHQLNFLAVGPASGPAGLPQVIDSNGRTVLLRGVNLNGLEDYWQDSTTPLAIPYPTSTSAYVAGACPRRNKAVESMAVCSLKYFNGVLGRPNSNPRSCR